MNNDEFLDLQKWYQKEIMLAERDHQSRRMNIEKDYCRSMQKAFEALPVNVPQFISEYVAIVQSSPSWSPLA